MLAPGAPPFWKSAGKSDQRDPANAGSGQPFSGGTSSRAGGQHIVDQNDIRPAQPIQCWLSERERILDVSQALLRVQGHLGAASRSP